MGKIYRELKRWAQRNEYVYASWIRIFRSKEAYEIICPDRRTDCFIAGWSRSGNTFSSWLVRKVYPDLKVVSHAHVIATLKMAKKYDIPTIVLFRDPGDVLTSMLAKYSGMFSKDEDKIKAALERGIRDWIAYYKYVLAECYDFRLLHFHDAVKHPVNIFLLLSQLGVREWDDSIDLKEKSEEMMRELWKEDLPAESQYIPNEKKESIKASFRPMVESHPLYNTAKALYRRLTQIAASDADVRAESS